TARVREAVDDQKRLTDRRHDHRNRPRRIFGGDRGRRSSNYNEVDPEPNQFGRQLREPFGAAIDGAIFDDIVFSFHVTKLAQALAEGVEMRGVERRRYGLQHPNWVTLHRLLRARRERPRRRCAADERDESAPLHSITSSARASSLSGTSRPSALAVLRLSTRSNLVDCMTGRSAGRSPLR